MTKQWKIIGATFQRSWPNDEFMFSLFLLIDKKKMLLVLFGGYEQNYFRVTTFNLWLNIKAKRSETRIWNWDIGPSENHPRDFQLILPHLNTNYNKTKLCQYALQGHGFARKLLLLLEGEKKS